MSVGRSELFTESFLVPVAGLDRSAGNPGELWAGSYLLNLVGGTVVALIAATHDALYDGSGGALVGLAEHVAGYGAATAFASAIVGRGADDVGTLLLLGTFDHAVVSQLESSSGCASARTRASPTSSATRG